MASYPPVDQAQWRIAIRFLTFGIMVAGLIAVMWWLARLADHLETQRELLVSIQADVLTNRAQVASVLEAAEQISHRMVTVEERTSGASEDRRQMRATDQQLTEALIRLRALVDTIHDPEALRNEAVEAPGPRGRPHPRR